MMFHMTSCLYTLDTSWLLIVGDVEIHTCSLKLNRIRYLRKAQEGKKKSHVHSNHILSIAVAYRVIAVLENKLTTLKKW